MTSALHCSRRNFLAGTLAAGASTVLVETAPTVTAQSAPERPEPKDFPRKVKLGIIGCGGRGSWLAGLFQKHGGYEIHALADYFPDRVEKAGDKFAVDKARRFSSLSGYRRLLQSGVEAAVVVNCPHFHAQHGYAAIEAGCHVYAAKPVAIDVPGALRVQAAGRLATQKKLCYLVDYQMPTDPINIEVVQRIHAGGLGRLGHIDSIGFSPPWKEWPRRTAEDRLRCWLTAVALSGDVITENSIHVINAVNWVAGGRPVCAVGRSRVCRPHPREDFREIYLVTYEFADGTLWTHRCQSLNNQLDWALDLNAYGDQATALVSYRGKSYLRGGPKHFGGGKIDSLYDQGAIRNIATFYRSIVEGRFDNPTAQQAGDDVLTAALGREAATRRCELTMEDLIKENKELKIDLSGLKS